MSFIIFCFSGLDSAETSNLEFSLRIETNVSFRVGFIVKRCGGNAAFCFVADDRGEGGSERVRSRGGGVGADTRQDGGGRSGTWTNWGTFSRLVFCVRAHFVWIGSRCCRRFLPGLADGKHALRVQPGPGLRACVCGHVQVRVSAPFVVEFDGFPAEFCAGSDPWVRACLWSRFSESGSLWEETRSSCACASLAVCVCFQNVRARVHAPVMD